MKELQYFPFERNCYYYGKFLTADVLDSEQIYMNSKRRFINRFIHGSGVIFGMSVLAVDENIVAVQPGAALDFAGREIVINQPMLLNLNSLNNEIKSSDAAVLYFCVEYDEYSDMLQCTEENIGQSDKVSEHYSFFLTEYEPPYSMNMAQRFYMQAEQVYSCKAFTIVQQLPVMVQAGGETVLTVNIQRRIRNVDVQFSYQVRLTGMKYGEERVIDISYDSQIQPLMEDKAVLKFPLHILLHADGEKAYVETIPNSFSGRFDSNTSGFSVCRMNTEIVMERLQECLLQKFRDEGMQQILSDSINQPPICLAAIHMKEKNGYSVIDKIQRMPFGQYISSDLSSEMTDFFTQKEKKEYYAENLQQNISNNAQKLMSQYSVASGIAEISMPMGGRTGQCFYSAPVSHELGIGKVSVTLGLVTSDTETIYGDTQVFAESINDVSAALAAKLDSAAGTFIIGILLKEPTSATKVRVHWTAMHNHKAEVTEHRPRLLIKPNITSLCVMENMTFEVEFEQMPKQEVHWSIAEGAKGGVITDGGAYTASNTPGVYQINVQAVESGMQATAFVSVRSLN